MGFSQFDEREYSSNQYYADNSTGDTFYYLAGNTVMVERVDAIIVVNTSASDQIVELALTPGGVAYPIGQVTIPALAGTAAVPPVDLVALLAPPSIGAIIIQRGATLQLRQVAALTGSDVVSAVTFGGLI
jgi:hypothetical protein